MHRSKAIFYKVVPILRSLNIHWQNSIELSGEAQGLMLDRAPLSMYLSVSFGFFSLKLFEHILSEDKQRALSKPHHISRM